MRTRPTHAELTAAVEAFRATADPAAPSSAYYQRVADNVAAIVGREAALGATADKAEHARLRALLNRDGPLEELVRALCLVLRNGTVHPEDPALLAHLRHTARETLAIDNPRYASYRRDLEPDPPTRTG